MQEKVKVRWKSMQKNSRSSDEENDYKIAVAFKV